MKDFINTLYKNHYLYYKVILFVFTTFLIVYLFPKSGKFKYSFENGKPWQSENLYAPFDFGIKKSDTEINAEVKKIESEAVQYFDIDSALVQKAIADYRLEFNKVYPDSLSSIEINRVYKKAQQILQKVYRVGILKESYDFDPNREVVLLLNQKEVDRTVFSNLININDIRQILEKEISNEGLDAYKVQLISLFFNVIQPNTSLNKNITDSVLKEELDKIAYTRGSIGRETLIISKGEVVEGEKFQILKSLESEYQSQVWSDSNYYIIVVAYTVLVALALLMLLLFLRKYRLDVYENNTKVTFIFFNVILMVLLTTLIVDFNSAYVYIIPICILPLVLKAFFDARLGLFTHVITVLLLGFIVPNNYEYMFLQIIAGIVTILTVSELYKRANLFISVGQITFIYFIAYFAFSVIHEGTTETLKWQVFGLFVINGLATLFVQPLIYAYEKMFGLVSDVSLLELSDTNTKLLKELSNKAPGTFHHSLNVANLAEASANEVGANAMLIRVGALYHDIGKMRNPTFFTENQSTGINPHDELSATESAQIIIRHVLDGIEIAKKKNLPDRIIDFIRTHHGTSVVYYFYMKEKNTNEDFNINDFKYPGPKPFSKETAILMMCDSVEAASKSLKEPTSSKIDVFVENIINKQMEDNQFINANITFKEIQSIKKVLKHKLANIYHLRIEYPE